ncbi:ribonuclease P [Prosthecochloris marina]|uniref:Ribonuclease P protein component n=1 Tax=Prosthecochloris marina TaxID=2017681 RepID=A0A317T3I8_9CHLB|nr:ribonuclease P [Prosthecochloris marina]
MFRDIVNSVRAHSLKKYEILRGSSSVSKLFSSARSYRGNFIKVLFAPLEVTWKGHRSLPKVLFIVGRKIKPNAVDRNRIKRLMKEAYRHEKALATECAGKYAGNGDRILCVAFMYIGRKKNSPSLGSFRKEIRALLEGIKSMAQC